MTHTDHVATMRKRILSFLSAQSRPVNLGDIKRYLGLDEWATNGRLDQALKSRRIRTERAHVRINTGFGGNALYVYQPIRLFSLARKQEVAA